MVTGGAGFIGSHLVERLVALGHHVRVVDNLSTGDEANLAGSLNEIEFLVGDLCEPDVCRRATAGVNVVFHVAALPSVPRSLKDPWASHAANVNATMRLLEACEPTVSRNVTGNLYDRHLKPLFVGESGIAVEDGTLQTRADEFRAKFAAQFAAGVVGELAWLWSPFDSIGYDIGPGDPALAVLGSF